MFSGLSFFTPESDHDQFNYIKDMSKSFIKNTMIKKSIPEDEKGDYDEVYFRHG